MREAHNLALQEALRRSEAHLASIIASVDGIVWEADAATLQFTFVSARAETLLGYPIARWLESATFWADHIHPDDRDAALEFCQRCTRERRNHQFEYRMIAADGRDVWLRDIVTFVAEPDGSATLRGIMTDVTAEKSASAALSDSERRLRLTTEAANVGLWDADLLAQTVWYSPEWKRQIGYADHEIPDLFEEWRVRLHPDDAAAAVARVDEFLAGDEPAYSNEFRLRHKDGSYRWIFSRASVVRDAQGRPIRMLGAHVDVTERKEAEHRLRQAEAEAHAINERFLQSQKMEAIGRLAGGVAHDFNNLLTIIGGYCRALETGLDAGEHAEAVREIGLAADRAAALTSQLLAFGRRAVTEPKVLDLNASIAETVKLLTRTLGEDVTLVTRLRGAPVYIRIDEAHVTHLLVNLAVNARDAMPQGGQLTVSTSRLTLDAGDAGRLEIPPGPYVRLDVADTGHGMTEDVRQRVFEPFFTTKARGEGTGLGLATVYGIVRQNGGAVDLASAPGQGSTFTVLLPEAPAPAGGPHQPARDGAPRGTETVLLVEDEPQVRVVVERMLSGLGYTVLTAASADEATAVLEASPLQPDLLLSDLVMRGPSGRELFERLSRRLPSLRVLFISGHTDDTVLRHGVLRSEVAFLQKPFTRDVLARKLREVLDRL